MLYNINWDVYPDWVRYLNRSANPQVSESNENLSRNRQKHTHEYLGSTKLAETGRDRHNHRFAGVTGEAIPTSHGNHKHEICGKTDYFGHFHEIKVCTGLAIDVGNGKHVHFVHDTTTTDDGHDHRYQFTTLIECPLLPQHNN